MSRRKLPIRQRHVPGCPQGRDCGCPWTFRKRLPDGTQPRVTMDTYAEAEQAYYELMARRPEPLADRTTTIGQWADRWLAMNAPNRAKNTVREYESLIRLHIKPHIGDYPVTTFRPDDHLLWNAAMREAGGSKNRRQAARTVLHVMYADWHKSRPGTLPYGNPVTIGLEKRAPRKQFTPLTAGQVAAWAAAYPVEMRIITEIQTHYGARISEILALHDGDITFASKDGTPLAGQLARLAVLPPERYAAEAPALRFERKLEKDRTVGRMKNDRAYRTLPLPQWLAAALAEQLGHWPPTDGWLFVNRRLAGGMWGPPHAVPLTMNERQRRYRAAQRAAARGEVNLGCGWGGKPYFEETYLYQARKAAAKAGIKLPPNQCTHALRHYCVSVLRAKGLDDTQIGKWIGDSAKTVGDVYGRPLGGAMDRIAELMTAERESARPALRVVR